MTYYQDIAACPSCGQDRLEPVLPGGVRYDNSLEPIIRGGENCAFPDFKAEDYAKVFWSVCRRCSTLFARRRPALDKYHPWYVALFEVSEERTYNTYPLPVAYLEGKAKGSQALFARLEAEKIFESAGSILHLRCAAGHLLKLIADAHPDIEVFGAEYFANPARHAKSLVGDDRIALIDGPEPRNPFPRKHYDIILVNHFMTHAHHPVGFVDYLLSLLSDTGKIVFYNELDHNLSLRSMSAYPRGLNFFHKQLYTRTTFRSFLASRGLAARDIDGEKKLPKYMTFIATRSVRVPMDPGDSAAARLLLRKWWRRSRVYKRLKWIINPARKILHSFG